MIDLVSLLAGQENIAVEAKLAAHGVPDSIWATYSSFANTAGGLILLGVQEDREHRLRPRGVEEPQRLMADIWNTLNNPQKISANILLDSHVYSMEYEGKPIVIIDVPRAERRDKPVYVGQDMFKGTYRRNHEGDYHCTKEEVRAMLRDQSDSSQDALLLENILISQLDQESVHRYRLLFNNLKPGHVWAKLADDEFLLKIGAARKSRVDGKIHPTLAGLLFFGDFVTITDELPNYFLDYRERLATDSRWSDRVCSGDASWSGNVFDFYYKVIDRLTADVKRPFQIDSRLQRIDDTPVHRCLRECLANALIHADYYGRRGIVIDKTFRHITFANPGTFRISPAEAIAGGISDARNGRIFNMFALINVGERSGTGLCDLYHVWRENGFRPPQLVETVAPERVTLTLELVAEGNGEVNEGNPWATDGNLDGNDGNSEGKLSCDGGKPQLADGNHKVNEGNHQAADGNARLVDGNHERTEGNPRRRPAINYGDIQLADGNLVAHETNPWLEGGKLGVKKDKGEKDKGRPEGQGTQSAAALSPKEALVLQLIAQDPKLSVAKIGPQTGLSRPTVERALRSLKAKGRIVREGSTRGRWVVL